MAASSASAGIIPGPWLGPRHVYLEQPTKDEESTGENEYIFNPTYDDVVVEN